MINCTVITFVVLCLSATTLSQQKVPQDNLTFKTIADHVNNYFSNQFNKILIIAKLSSIFGAKASFKATNHFSLHNRIKRSDNFSTTLTKFHNKLQHMLVYNKHILQYLNNVTQTAQIQKQLCLIEAIEEILFSFETLSTDLNSPAIVKRHALATNFNNNQQQSPFLSALKFLNWQNFMRYVISQTLNLTPHKITKRQVLTTLVKQNITQILYKIPQITNQNPFTTVAQIPSQTHTIFNVTLTQGDDTSNQTKGSLAYENALILLAIISLIILIIIQCTCRKTKQTTCPQIPKLNLHV
jgi:hypothetical protein